MTRDPKKEAGWMRFLPLMLLGLGTLALTSRAEEPSPMPSLHIDLYKSGMDKKEFRKIPGAQVEEHATKGRIPPRDERETIFARVPGLSKDVSRMDELDRDMLLLRARHDSLDQLSKTYPKIPKSRLKALQNEIKREKRNER